ncbi:LysR family transcriptional regulator [Nocardiopsis sp. CNT-189]|uniref:LysR family transcriptional regulator n=1 Tax=Nocardiopsis oceanisediminis TaxID=2816862 RepID=UPI003B366C5A
MNQVHVQQIECLIVLSEELHFGRAAERLGVSRSRVSQLVAALERRIGVRLVQRTSRRVSLTRFGAQFVDEVRPAYETLAAAFLRARDRAMRGALRELRIGFHGSLYEEVAEAFRRLRTRHEVAVALSEIPLGSPFTAVLEGRLDAAMVELPVHEDRLTVGYRFPPQDRLLAVAAGHPLAGRERVHAEELAGLDLLHPAGDAPDYWTAARVPPTTPSGAPIRSTTGITTVQEGLALVAGGDRAMLVCRPLAEHTPRGDMRCVPVDGLAERSQMALIWRTADAAPQLAALARLLEEEYGGPGPEAAGPAGAGEPRTRVGAGPG